MIRTAAVALFLLGIFAASPAAYAHPFHVAPTGGFHVGWVHPWSGIDHLLAVIIVGVLASQLPIRFGWTLPAAFCVATSLGASAASQTGSSLLGQFGLACVLAGLGVCLWQQRSEMVLLTMAVIGGIAHGASHDFSSSGSTSTASAIVGLVAMTALLHLAGYAAGIVIAHSRLQTRFLKTAALATGLVAVCTAVGVL